jgi:hydroxymethylglutaryl-CoA synthase
MIGIDDMAFYVPNIYLSIKELAEARNIEYAKLNKGLGLTTMSLADVHEDAASMAANAVLKLIKKNNLKPQDIGRIYVGSESATDGAKPIASYVVSMLADYFKEEFGENSFIHTDVVDMTFACIAGIDAMHTTLDWVNADSRRIGIVVATDNAKYELESTGEYTQGAGAVATLIKHNPRLLAIDNQVGISTISEHDFFKPVRKIKKSELIKVLKGSGNSIPNLVSENEEYVEIHKIFPVFDGQYSNKCYSNRMSEAYNHFVKLKEGAHKLEDWDKLVFHLPYAFHGKRAFADVFWATYKEDEKLKEQLLALDPDFFSHQTLKLVTRTEMYKDFVSQKVEKGQRASSYTGNLYTASIFMSFMSMLETELLEGKDISREKIGFCAYGSGSKSKVFEGEIQKNWKEVVAKFEIFSSLEKREAIDFETYEDLHNEKLATSIKSPKGFYLESISEDETLYGVRKYAFAK